MANRKTNLKMRWWFNQCTTQLCKKSLLTKWKNYTCAYEKSSQCCVPTISLEWKKIRTIWGSWNKRLENGLWDSSSRMLEGGWVKAPFCEMLCIWAWLWVGYQSQWHWEFRYQDVLLLYQFRKFFFILKGAIVCFTLDSLTAMILWYKSCINVNEKILFCYLVLVICLQFFTFTAYVPDLSTFLPFENIHK